MRSYVIGLHVQMLIHMTTIQHVCNRYIYYILCSFIWRNKQGYWQKAEEVSGQLSVSVFVAFRKSQCLRSIRASRRRWDQQRTKSGVLHEITASRVDRLIVWQSGRSQTLADYSTQIHVRCHCDCSGTRLIFDVMMRQHGRWDTPPLPRASHVHYVAVVFLL